MAEINMTLTHTPAIALILLPYTDDTSPGPQVRIWIVSPGEEIPKNPLAFMCKLLYDDARDKYPDMTVAEFKAEIRNGVMKLGEPIVMLLPDDDEKTAEVTS